MKFSAKMVFTKEDDQLESLERRLERLADERPIVIGRLLCEIVERMAIGDNILQDCEVLDREEWTGEYRD